MNIQRLEAWYVKNHRKLLFRETKDPYKIWISEIMLQQTQVDTVLPYYERFINKYPSVLALSKTDEDTLKKEVEGLGYYRRFKNMLLAAKVIANNPNAVMPNTYQGLLDLPGIGHYTAGAIMSIAYDKPYSALDGNVIRVLSRFYDLKDDFRVEKNRKKLNKINQSLIEKATPNLYTQSMMELGATLCKPKSFDCANCPLNEACKAFKNKTQSLRPVMSKLKSKKEIHYITLRIKDQEGHLFLRKRDESLLEGMYEYPQFEADSINYVIDLLENQGINIHHIQHLKQVKHVFTHLIWHMDVYEMIISEGLIDWIKVNQDQFRVLPMATAHKKIR